LDRPLWNPHIAALMRAACCELIHLLPPSFVRASVAARSTPRPECSSRGAVSTPFAS
jgi:hypothetical protein